MTAYVGIDAAKATLVLCLQPEGRTWKRPSTPAGQAQVVAELRAVQPERIALEATGGYERAIWQQLQAAGLTVVRLQPRRVKALARALGWQAKTDPLDAALLAEAARILVVPVTVAPDAATEALRALVDLRRQLVSQRDDNQRRLKQSSAVVAQRAGTQADQRRPAAGDPPTRPQDQGAAGGHGHHRPGHGAGRGTGLGRPRWRHDFRSWAAWIAGRSRRWWVLHRTTLTAEPIRVNGISVVAALTCGGCSTWRPWLRSAPTR
jgi:hypothetical protein